MPRINCSVESCAYNNQKICEAEILHIGGKGANWTESTCCETYKDIAESKNAVDNMGATKEIVCKVETCAYNEDRRCNLGDIEVSSLGEVSNYSETDCLSFERR